MNILCNMYFKFEPSANSIKLSSLPEHLQTKVFTHMSDKDMHPLIKHLWTLFAFCRPGASFTMSSLGPRKTVIEVLPLIWLDRHSGEVSHEQVSPFCAVYIHYARHECGHCVYHVSFNTENVVNVRPTVSQTQRCYAINNHGGWHIILPLMLN